MQFFFYIHYTREILLNFDIKKKTKKTNIFNNVDLLTIQIYYTNSSPLLKTLHLQYFYSFSCFFLLLSPFFLPNTPHFLYQFLVSMLTTLSFIINKNIFFFFWWITIYFKCCAYRNTPEFSGWSLYYAAKQALDKLNLHNWIFSATRCAILLNKHQTLHFYVS